MARVEPNAQHRTGTIELFGALASDNVAHGNVELTDRQVGRLIHANERPSVLHEVLETDHAFGSDAADVFGSRGIGGAAAQDRLRAHRGQDQAVVSIMKVPRQDVGVVHRRIVVFERVEDVSRPSLIHACRPRLIETDARRGSLDDRALDLLVQSGNPDRRG